MTADFLKNWGGDNPRFNAGGMHVPGDHLGQETRGYRWPFGPVALVAPFNFPLEIPVLQLMGALMMGNRCTMKASEKTSMVMDQYLRLLHHCGMPKGDVDLIHCGGDAMGALIDKAPFRTTQFTGSSRVAEHIAVATAGKVRIEDAGFDWKILGPDVGDEDYVAWVCDQDAYACSGQKCSAQSMLFMHENWTQVRFSCTRTGPRCGAKQRRIRPVRRVCGHDDITTDQQADRGNSYLAGVNGADGLR